MRKLALTGAVLLTALTACSAPATEPKVDMEAMYVSVHQERFPKSDRDSALTIGRKICDDFKAGSTFEGEVSYLMVLAEWATGKDAGFMIGNATGTLCPEYANRH